MDVGNTVTLFLDPKLDNSFMKSLHHDLQSVYGKKILTTSQQVISTLLSKPLLSSIQPQLKVGFKQKWLCTPHPPQLYSKYKEMTTQCKCAQSQTTTLAFL